jgi:ELWxxDGT repeat protein
MWVTDGTAAGTQLFFAGVPGAPTHCDRLTVVRDRLFFAGRDVTHGQELWVSDGTQAGSHLVLDTVPGTSGMTPSDPKPFGDLLLYRVSAAGAEGLWRSDGTAAGTFRVSMLQGTEALAAGARHAWFRGYDIAAGNELWRTDGTAAGTAHFADLLPGDGSSEPGDLALSNGRLYFAATHEGLGRELWQLDLDATTQAIGFGCAFGGAVASRLWGDDPAMGTTASFRVVGAPPIGISVALFTNFVPGHRPLGPGCDLFVDYNPLILGVELFQGGAATHPLAVPINPALDDQLFRVQVLTLSITTVLELGLSNALTLTIGT